MLSVSRHVKCDGRSQAVSVWISYMDQADYNTCRDQSATGLVK